MECVTPMADPADAFDTVHVDEHLLVLNKPSGLLSVPGRGEDKQDCLSRRVQARYPDALIVHRLDMATSGLMLMAIGPTMQRALSGLFERREVHKCYQAVVAGHAETGLARTEWALMDGPIAVDWPRRPLRIIDPVQGKPSQTRWRLVSHDAQSNTTRVELEPITGRSHQLRVHLQALGHAILGDALYGGPRVQELSTRLLLHASALAFDHPLDNRCMEFASPAPF